VSLKQIARELRRQQTDEEKKLWRALHGRRFAGFKFRLQYPVGDHILDFYCAEAKLAVELDGFQHGLPEGIRRDAAREKFLVDQGIETLRCWNSQWRENREGCLLEIWNAVQQRSGCVRVMKNAGEQRFVPPDVKEIKFTESKISSPWPSPRLARRGGKPPGSSYAEAIQFLYGLQMFGANFRLENTRKLAALAGNPQEKLRFIHVAGTNGKGSTCAMLESIYRAAGLRVGLFTSPHLVSFRERIQVNRQLISEADVTRLVAELERGTVSRSTLKADEAFKSSHALDAAMRCGSQTHAPGNIQDACPTLFEFATVMALKFFAEQKCDLVIWETGLGGRLDATNIVTPLASVITNIAFDHQQWLGDTLEKIAAEKAGIIKPGIPVVTAVENSEALAVIEKFAKGKNAPLTKLNSKFKIQNSKLPLLGEHQKINAALALATVEVLQKQIPVNEEKIREGLQNVNWPGRLQLIEKSDGQKILLDGAHNVAGVEALRAALPAGVPLTFIVGFLGDKDWRPMCEILAPLAAKIFCVPVASTRTSDARELAKTFRAANPTAEVLVCDSLREALKKSGSRGRSPHHAQELIVVTGSLYLVGEALELLGYSPAGAGERGLNEWSVNVLKR
jgi:dihydrofolate synthase / folylpolyglutamate synthase